LEERESLSLCGLALDYYKFSKSHYEFESNLLIRILNLSISCYSLSEKAAVVFKKEVLILSSTDFSEMVNGFLLEV
jgi:hypothetical protein